MSARRKAALIWGLVVCFTAVAAAWLFAVDWWIAALFAAASLTINGLVATREDRGHFND